MSEEADPEDFFRDNERPPGLDSLLEEFDSFADKFVGERSKIVLVTSGLTLLDFCKLQPNSRYKYHLKSNLFLLPNSENFQCFSLYCFLGGTIIPFEKNTVR